MMGLWVTSFYMSFSGARYRPLLWVCISFFDSGKSSSNLFTYYFSPIISNLFFRVSMKYMLGLLNPSFISIKSFVIFFFIPLCRILDCFHIQAWQLTNQYTLNMAIEFYIFMTAFLTSRSSVWFFIKSFYGIHNSF